jgi:hypothetical protein
MCLNKGSVELVQEFAKDCVYENPEILKDQFYVTAIQARRINRLIGKVDFIISDSPVLLGEIYKSKKSFLDADFYLKLFDNYQNINFFLNRTFPYVQDGRVHSESDSSDISVQIKKLLNNYSIPFIDLESHYKTHEIIFNLLNKKYSDSTIRV